VVGGGAVVLDVVLAAERPAAPEVVTVVPMAASSVDCLAQPAVATAAAHATATAHRCQPFPRRRRMA
jgi:hypothetical protein